MAEISRRTLFSGTLLVTAAAAGAALGLTRAVHHKVAVPPVPPPAALLAALGRQQSLLAGYQQLAAGAGPAPASLGALRSDLVAHGAALRGLLERYPGWRLAGSSAASPSPPSVAGQASAPPTTVPALALACRAAATSTSTACAQWPAGEPQAGQVVPVLGSIAACLSTHAEVLS